MAEEFIVMPSSLWRYCLFGVKVTGEKENSRKGAKTQRMREHERGKTIVYALAAFMTWRENELFLNNALHVTAI